ncbi:DUF4915 domain-containing protein [Candidatus Parcubacteria bacterium]|nr:MAG: DUF4915 domain-containing protein [Candidatus Parcubacteria bacterium]
MVNGPEIQRKRFEEAHRRANEELRNPVEVVSYEITEDHWNDYFQYKTTGAWWEILQEKEVTLLVTREYEHLILAMNCRGNCRNLSFFKTPHPSGLCVDDKHGALFAAATRNPNQVIEFKTVKKLKNRSDCTLPSQSVEAGLLLPIRVIYLPGCIYLHEIARIDGQLYGNSVGQNCIVRIDLNEGRHERAWWPKCIETKGVPDFRRNYIQLNSIAAGDSLERSFFTASSCKPGLILPGDRNFPVDGTGVIFSGKSREPIAFGLTRPHSARQHQGSIWVNNSGYGEFGFIEGGRFVRLRRLDGWTRGLCFCDDIAFVGTSRVLPRFECYAPGIDRSKSVCGVFAVSTKTAEVLGGICWPNGNQVFSVEAVDSMIFSGFPLSVDRDENDARKIYDVFYRFQL